MELRHLEYFLTLSKELHFTRAAEKLGISQPTLSHQTKILEQEIGLPLFNRIGKKIELTRVGEIVLKEALNIQGSLNNMSDQIKALTKVEIGELKIAVLPGEMTDLVSTICIPFHQRFPNIKVWIETTDQIEQAILENQADFGIGYQFSRHELLQARELYTEQFYLISNQENTTQPLHFSSIAKEALILFPKIHQCRKIVEQISERTGQPIEPIVETSSISSILDLVRNGVGSSIVSRTLYEFYDTADLFYQPIQETEMKRAVQLLMKKDAFINYAATEFIDLLIREIEKLHFPNKQQVAQI